MIQMLTLEEWAADKYRSNPPSVSTLRRYAKQNLFFATRDEARKIVACT